MLNEPHMTSLASFVLKLRENQFGVVPDFDPMDGGAEAKVLFLMEKPGPMAAASGFISRNNDDPTAENTFKFMIEAGLSRNKTCIWNAIPGWNGERHITRQEHDRGLEHLHELIALMTRLRAVVLVGRKAQAFRSALETTKLVVFESFHPSPINRAAAYGTWSNIPSQWAKVIPYID